MDIIWQVSHTPHGNETCGDYAKGLVRAYSMLPRSTQPREIRVNVIGFGAALYDHLFSNPITFPNYCIVATTAKTI